MFVLLLFSSIFLMLAPITSVEASSEDIVLHYKLYPEPLYNGVEVVGEVINNLATAISEVNISVTFHDIYANELTKGYGSAFLQVIPPGRRSAFLVLFQNFSLNYAYYEAKVLSYNMSNPKPIGLSLLHALATQYSNYTEIVGTVQNTASVTLQYVSIFALFYDEDGNFIEATDADTSLATLEADNTGTFDLFTRHVNDTVNVTKCIITGESWSYGLDEEKVIYSKADEDGLFKYAIPAAIIIGVGAFLSSFILLRRGYKKRKHGMKSKPSTRHSTSRVSKHLNSWLIAN
jgi:hypothetical protein